MQSKEGKINNRKIIEFHLDNKIYKIVYYKNLFDFKGKIFFNDNNENMSDFDYDNGCFRERINDLYIIKKSL